MEIGNPVRTWIVEPVERPDEQPAVEQPEPVRESEPEKVPA